MILGYSTQKKIYVIILFPSIPPLHSLLVAGAVPPMRLSRLTREEFSPRNVSGVFVFMRDAPFNGCIGASEREANGCNLYIYTRFEDQRSKAKIKDQRSKSKKLTSELRLLCCTLCAGASHAEKGSTEAVTGAAVADHGSFPVGVGTCELLIFIHVCFYYNIRFYRGTSVCWSTFFL